MLAWTRRFFRPRRRQSALIRSFAFAVQSLESRQVLNAVTVQLPAVRDTTIYDSGGQALSNGTGQFLVSGGPSGAVAARRGLLAFDLQSAAIPVGATIIDAVLTLNVAESFGNMLAVGLHPVSKSWGESGSDAPGNELDGTAAAAGDATWLFSLFDSTAWTLPGGDIGGASAIAQIGGQGAWQWTGGGLVADVQTWLDQPQSNHGWMLRSSESLGDIKTFHSRNSTNPALQPFLEITYQEPFVPSVVEGRKWHDRNADGIRQSALLTQLRLFHPNGNTFYNSLGGREYWFRSPINSNWYFLTPEGELKQWSGMAGKLTGTTVEQVGTRAWHNRTLITDLSTVASEPWLNGFVVELVDQNGSVVATTSTRDMDRNNDGKIDAEQEQGWYRFDNVAPGKYTVREVLSNGWLQTAGRTSAGAAAAHSLDQSLNLSFGGNLYENVGGLGERWLKGGTSWYYITPAGNLFRWNNRPITATAPLTGTQIASPGSAYYRDVSLLHSAEDPLLTVTSGSVTTRIDFGNYQPSVIEGRGWIDTDPNGMRNPSRLPTAVLISRPAEVPISISAIAWYEVYAPTTDPLLGTESGTLVRRVFYLTSAGQVFEWTSGSPPRLFTQISAAAGSAAVAISRAAFAAEPWQNGVTIQLLNASGYVVAETVTADSDRNADGTISADTEQGWYRFTGLPPGQYSLRQVLPTGSIAVTEAPSAVLKTAQTFADTWRFESAPSDHFNFGGRNERWFRSRSQEWFYILPSGAVHQWDRKSGGRAGLVNGTLIGQLSGAFYVNLSLLFQPPAASFSLSTGQTIQRNLSQVRLLDTVFSSLANEIRR